MTVRKSHFKMRRCDCGAVPRVGSDRCEDSVTTFVFCPSCGTRGAEVEDISLAEADAVRCWNLRDMEPRNACI